MRRKSAPDKARALAATRMRRISIPEVLDWSDVCAASVWTCLEEYRKAPDQMLLIEAEIGLQSLLGVVDELRRRT